MKFVISGIEKNKLAFKICLVVFLTSCLYLGLDNF